ncbi:MAG: hypothetical protein JWM91_5062 [Rhodospirillales bacterium]|nr:hypothetical protein [Rhodospirillales bacterium]
MAMELATEAPKSKRKWSADVTENRDAINLEGKVFEWHDPKQYPDVARALGGT